MRISQGIEKVENWELGFRAAFGMLSRQNVDFSHKVEAAETWRESKDCEEVTSLKQQKWEIKKQTFRFTECQKLVDLDICDVSLYHT